MFIFTTLLSQHLSLFTLACMFLLQHYVYTTSSPLQHSLFILSIFPLQHGNTHLYLFTILLNLVFLTHHTYTTRIYTYTSVFFPFTTSSLRIFPFTATHTLPPASQFMSPPSLCVCLQLGLSFCVSRGPHGHSIIQVSHFSFRLNGGRLVRDPPPPSTLVYFCRAR